ncbi:MAG TPA: sigma 54-interacting transcriptional regulator, partial [Longimicrobiales bacterium]
GAVARKIGKFEAASGGTLFLDEIGDMNLPLQGKLLRVLQEHAFERVGDTRTRTADVRVVAATHVNLARAVAEHRFREDLYYRLRVVPIDVPPLRERREDLPVLVRFLLQRIAARRGRSLRLSPAASRALLSYDWPGNVRELENALEYATTICAGQTVHLTDLPDELMRATAVDATLSDAQAAERGGEAGRSAEPGPRPEREAATATASGLVLSAEEAAEAARIRAALEQARWRRDDAAQALGMSRTTLWRKMKEYRL